MLARRWGRVATRRAWRVATAALFAASLYFLLTPAPPEPPGVDPTAFGDFGHLVLFALLGFAARRAVGGPAWAVWLALAAYGALTELVQTQVPHRSGNVADALRDAGAALTAFLPAKRQPERG